MVRCRLCSPDFPKPTEDLSHVAGNLDGVPEPGVDGRGDIVGMGTGGHRKCFNDQTVSRAGGAVVVVVDGREVVVVPAEVVVVVAIVVDVALAPVVEETSLERDVQATRATPRTEVLIHIQRIYMGNRAAVPGYAPSAGRGYFLS